MSDKCGCGAVTLGYCVGMQGAVATHDHRLYGGALPGCPWCGATPTVNHNLAMGWSAVCIPCRVTVGPFPCEAGALDAWRARLAGEASR